jgi:kynurenine formamidase
MSDFPRYRELPVDPTSPPLSSWGVFGADDEVGTVNFITPERVLAATSLVREGAVFALNWGLELPDPPLFRRRRLTHRLVELEPTGTDDYYDAFYPQASSHWDALRHTSYLAHGEYNSLGGHEGTNGIEHWARRGIVGRFVLADIAGRRAAVGDRRSAGERSEVSVSELVATLGDQRVQLHRGDILLVRTGWIEWYEHQARDVRAELAQADVDFESIGLAADEATAEWLWDNGIAAIAADNPALEATPFDESSLEGYLHYRLIALLGMAVGEMFKLDGLAAHCRSDGRWEGLFTSAPLNKVGGSGSPANALAVK